MGQSLVNNYVHIVFSTKNRKPLIYSPYEDDLYAYIGGICNQLECHVLIVGGHVDHVHILCKLSKKLALMTLVQKIKANSSKWIKTKDNRFKDFFWQDGYAAFSVNPREVDAVINYIKNQHEHHRKRIFKDELRSFLNEYDMEFDEKYVWE